MNWSATQPANQLAHTTPASYLCDFGIMVILSVLLKWVSRKRV